MQRVYFHDARTAGLCARGFRNWAKARNWSNDKVRDFLQNGMPIEEAEAIDDAFAQRAVSAARERIQQEAARG